MDASYIYEFFLFLITVMNAISIIVLAAAVTRLQRFTKVLEQEIKRVRREQKKKE